MKILIIDDERAIRNSLKEILMDEGYEADVAEDGAQGVDMALKEKYSVIFCDIKMPNMDGIEVLDKFMEEGVDAAVIMISGHGDIDTAVECIKKGARCKSAYHRCKRYGQRIGGEDIAPAKHAVPDALCGSQLCSHPFGAYRK